MIQTVYYRLHVGMCINKQHRQVQCTRSDVHRYDASSIKIIRYNDSIVNMAEAKMQSVAISGH